VDQRPEVAEDLLDDCDESGASDADELATGALLDCDEDGVPDACQALHDGCVLTEENGWYEYQAGTLPVILSAPHGGQLTPEELDTRPDATVLLDTATQELAEAIATALHDRTGQRPHVVLMHLRRDKVEANAWTIEDATAGQPEAEAVYWGYHDWIDQARHAVATTYGRGLYIDLHGMSADALELELGYLLSASTMYVDDDRLDHPGYAGLSSLRGIWEAHVDEGRELAFSELFRGPQSMGGLLETAGFLPVPSPSAPWPTDDDGELEGYFDGGYSTSAHGSRAGGRVSGLQIEHAWDEVRDSSGREAYAEALAESIETWLDTWVDLSLSGAGVVGFAQADAELWEAGEAHTLWLERRGDLREALTVELEVGGSSDHADVVVPDTVSFVAGEARASFTLIPSDDEDVEGPEVLELSVSRSDAYNVGPVASLSVHLADDEAPSVRLAEGARELTEGEAWTLSVVRDDCATAGSVRLDGAEVSFAEGEHIVEVELSAPAVEGRSLVELALTDPEGLSLTTPETVVLDVLESELDEGLVLQVDGTESGERLLDRAGRRDAWPLPSAEEGPAGLTFDGLDDAVLLDDTLLAAPAESLGLAFWFRAASEGADNYRYIFSHSATWASGALNVYLTSGGTLRTVSTGADEDYDTDLLDVPGDFFDDSWHHYALSLDDGVAEVYVDGALAATAVRGVGGVTRDGYVTYVGVRNTMGTSTHWWGDLADLRLYDGPLESEDVEALAAEAP